MDFIDLRSDTLSLPTEEMLEAIRYATLGDDVRGEDPTVQRLEALGANMFGKEASLFTVSGTMANQIAVMVYTSRGQEVILGEESHIYNLEVAGLAALCQVQARPIACPTGYFNPEDIENAIQPAGIQTASTGLICLENTYNLNRGMLMLPENIRQIRHISNKYEIPLYLDGARVLNAATALSVDVKEIVGYVDSVQLCLTKGLAAPVGSLLMGDRDFITRARRIRQRLGGGMRQGGIIAGAGIVALETMIPQLSLDHEHAQLLAQGLYEIDERLVNPEEVQTNIVAIDTGPLGINGDEFLRRGLRKKIKIRKIGATSFRMVCYHNISQKHIEQTVEAFGQIINELRCR